ncbi:MAG TPA: hypothetical protein VM687_03255 [Stenotrophomonas sp.]|nr:hypothetical protein [Stenotrophomonas sp.]
MNLPLHFGLLGSLEAGLIALLIGLGVYWVSQSLCRRAGLSLGHAVGWACLAAVAIGAGWDIWNLFYTSIVRLESPLYARLALQSIHDPDQLGGRVVLEVAGALAGVALGWRLFSADTESADITNS